MQPLVIIPTYNERDNIPRLIAEIRSRTPGVSILVVDDNSPDGTGAVVERLATNDDRLYLLTRPKKEGLGRAYQAAFSWALQKNFDPICTMDADLSHDPRHLPELLRGTETAAVSLGSRYIPGGQIVGWSWDRYALSWGANFITRLLLHLKPRDVTAGYKCYRREFLAQLPLNELVSAGYAFQVEMILAARDADVLVIETPITFHDRTIGRSKVSRHELISSSHSLLQLASRQRGLRQIAKFAIVGGGNFLLDISITNLLVLAIDWHPVYAGYVGTLFALGTSFFLNRRWTFRADTGAITHQAGRFLLIHGTGAAINALTYTVLIRQFGIWYNLAKVLAIGGSGLWNFFLSKYWVFRESPATHQKKESEVKKAVVTAK